MSTQHINEERSVPEDAAGERLDRIAAQLFPDFSRSRLQGWIKSGELTVDDRTVTPRYKLLGAELLRLNVEIKAESTVQPQDIPLDVLFADEHIIIINKPAGLVVHPAVGNADGTLQNGLLNFDPELAALPRAGIVHRLDKDTSGVMVVARSLLAHKKLVDGLQERSVSREYRALVTGEVPVGGTIDQPIGRHPKDRIKMAVVHGGKPSVTHFRISERFRGYTLLKVNLESGRTHQIRVHMAHAGYPVLGDRLYGGRPKIPAGLDASLIERLRTFPRQALHAYQLSFEHPGTGRPSAHVAEIPDDMNQLIGSLVPA